MTGRPGHGAREKAVRARIEALPGGVPPTFANFVAVGLTDQTPFGVAEHLLPALATRLTRPSGRP